MPDTSTALPPVSIGYDLDDLTLVPRFSLKGIGSSAWLKRRNVALPGVNRSSLATEGIRVVQLNRDDILLLGQAGSATLSDLVADWLSEEGPKGYRSWREEGWAWMRLAATSGPDLIEGIMAALCAVDLRVGRIEADHVVQTRIAGLDAVILPGTGQGSFDLFFDIASKAYAERAIAIAAEGAASGRAGSRRAGA